MPRRSRISNAGSPKYRSKSLPLHLTAGSRLLRDGHQTQGQSNTNFKTTDNRTKVFQSVPFTSHHNRYLHNTCYYPAKWQGESLVRSTCLLPRGALRSERLPHLYHHIWNAPQCTAAVNVLLTSHPAVQKTSKFTRKATS
jgi:hypothetical protein